ncbi:SusD/RagB family nutrient-binding outer membrane lipoprotein [Hymenobacter busanensis]|uniref:SusD/RagB family nutrient-binding outer membrane lipoprotein n=1 Tax=Hymenobacter busanensis TaxID=2607656 RepID=A0A7L4ZRV5_9BACT|nr:SusD/RagB family nutrient-binding outer membrane lipoprotein [Hymenobacter busanensis]KAA9327260.1 SusD/RagB family nutrient-binding outer membrane lipoprotein [Hymenobacter busanensis]QHJ05924.1 SusD/RagB family nutrient-binding outer membrane lipoprotein [Hymenobacter busanensis]
MKRKLYSLLLLAALVGLLPACTDNFEEINTNPNAPVDVQPSLLLRKIIFDYGEQMSYEAFVAGNLLGQYFTAIDFNLFDRHSLSEPQYGGNPWPFLYSNLRDNEILLQKARSNPAFGVYEGPALIMKAYLAATLTDLYGDVPYSQALQGKAGVITPAYDTQESIYTAPGGILDNLDNGIASINGYTGTTALDGDVLYGGNRSKWVQFANSLKIKYLMRISRKVNVQAALQRVVTEGNYIQANADNAAFRFSLSQPNNFRMATARIGDYNLFIMSKTSEELLTGLSDPRIATYFRPTAANPGTYRGLLNGPDASRLSISVADYSLTGTIFRENSDRLSANYMTAAETSFWLAEAAERNLISASARTLYEQGITQSFDYWGTVLPTGYLTGSRVAYGQNGQNPIEQILTQKWLHNINNGYEGWTEYRRTGFPRLKTVSASLNNGLVPVRMPYPATESALNAAQYNIAAANTQNNSINAPVWWAR